MPELVDSTPAKANTTPMVDDHPNHHNDLTTAINALHTRLEAIEAAIPTDGETGEALVMASNDDRDTEWTKLKTIPANPGEGWAGKILAAASETTWAWTELSSLDDVVLPSQTGKAGQFLKTNGSSTSWGRPIPVQPDTGTKWLKTVGGALSWGTLAPGTMPNEEDASDGDVVVYSSADGIHWAPVPTEIPSLTGVPVGSVLKKTDVDSYGWDTDETLPDSASANIGDVITKLGPGVAWAAPATGIPAGGAAGQVIEHNGTTAVWGRKITVSASAPSGGTDGDIWFEV